jgi:hypothetical protein
MTTLREICQNFEDELEELVPASADLASRIKGLITRLAKDASEHVADDGMGEIPALLQRCHEALAALAAEAEDAEDRRCRYRSRAAVLNLLLLADGVARFHGGKQKPADVAALRDLVADALSGLVELAAE